MRLKAASFFTSVYILAFVINCYTLAESVLNIRDVGNSCQNKEQVIRQNDKQMSSGEPSDGVPSEKPRDTDILNVFPKNNISEFVGNNSNCAKANVTVPVSCITNKTYEGVPVEIVNASQLAFLLQVEPNVTNRQVPGHCITVLFYSPTCPFSCMAAPHFNALPRFFPDLKMIAIDAMQHRGFNAQFGIVGTPTLMLFHSGRPAAKFNETSEYGLEVFANFITKHTGIEPVGKLVVTSSDFGGPVSSILVHETDYYLLLSWLIIAARILYSLYYSTWGRSFVDATLNAWREAEAQHHHVE